MENQNLLQQTSLFSSQQPFAENLSENNGSDKSSEKSHHNSESNNSSQQNTRLYIKIPQEILEKLNQHYDELRYPTQQQMEEIGKEFGYSVEKIDNWYKRKRRNEAKLGHIQIKRKQQFSQQIKQKLNKFYDEYKLQLIRDEDVKPSTQELMRMSKIIGLTVQQIRSWFSVRRQKEYIKNQQKLKDNMNNVSSINKPTANELNEHDEVIKKLKKEEQQQTIENITFKSEAQQQQNSSIELQNKQFLQSNNNSNNNATENQLRIQNQMMYDQLVLKMLNNLQPPQQSQQQSQLQQQFGSQYSQASTTSPTSPQNNNFISQMLMLQQQQQMPITNTNNNNASFPQNNKQYVDLLNMYRDHCQQNQLLSQRLIESLENQNQIQFNMECQKQRQLLLPQITQQNQLIMQNLLNKLQNINQQQKFVSEKMKNYNKFLEMSQQQQQLNFAQHQQQPTTHFFQQNQQQQQFIQQQQNNQINNLIQQILLQQQQQQSQQQQYQF